MAVIISLAALLCLVLLGLGRRHFRASMVRQAIAAGQPATATRP